MTVHWLLALASSYPFWRSSFPEDRRHLNHETLASEGQTAALADLIRKAPITTEVTMVEVTAGPMVEMGADTKFAEERRSRGSMPTALRRSKDSNEPQLGHRADRVSDNQMIEQSDIDQRERFLEPDGN